MARTVRDARIETRTARAALRPSGKPYYRSIDEGLHLGYRKGKKAGKWVLRRYVGSRSYTLEAIGSADDILDSDGARTLSFSEAQAKARTFHAERNCIAAGVPVHAEPYTVADCRRVAAADQCVRPRLSYFGAGRASDRLSVC